MCVLNTEMEKFTAINFNFKTVELMKKNYYLIHNFAEGEYCEELLDLEELLSPFSDDDPIKQMLDEALCDVSDATINTIFNFSTSFEA